MRLIPILLFALLGASTQAMAGFVISEAAGTFTPSFRAQPNSYYFGWDRGTFDGSNLNALLDDPEITLGTTSLDPLVSLTADPAAVISSTGNIYKNGAALNASLVVPVPAVAAGGFTTIIVQGGGVQSPYTNSIPVFGVAGGDVPDVAVGSNADTSGHPDGRGQFWAKYEIVGSAANYVVPITGALASSVPSIAELRVDVLWSADGFAPDSAVVAPEPTSLVGLIVAAAFGRRRR